MPGVRDVLGRVRERVASPPAVALVGFVALAVALFRRAWAAPTDAWVGTPGDPALHMWFLKWTPWALTHGANPLFSKYIDLPDGVNMMWNTFEPLTALVVSPVTFLVGLVAAYNVVITMAVALSGWCFYLFVRRHTTHETAAVAGGLLYGFSPFVVSQALTHSNLVQVYLPPLLLIVAEEILVRQRRSYLVDGAFLGVLLAAQVFVSEELLVYEVLVLSLGALVLAIVHRDQVRERAPHVVRSVAAGAVVAVVLAGGPLAFQFFGPERVTHGAALPPEARSSDLLSFVVPTELQQVHPAWAKTVTDKFTDACCIDEWGSYMGAPLLGLLVVTTALAWRRDVVKLAAVVGAVFVVLSMGPHLHVGGLVTSTPMPYHLFEHVPVLHNVQPRRLMVVGWMAAATLLAVFVDAVMRRRRRPTVAVAGALALLVALVPLLPTFRFPATKVDLPPFFTSDAVVRLVPRDSVVLVAPFARDPSTSAPMLWQAEADFRYRMPDGYVLGPDADGAFTTLPDRTPLSEALQARQRGEPGPPFTPETRAAYAADLARWGVTIVIVGPHLNEANTTSFVTELLGRPPQRVGGVWLWRGVDAIEVAAGGA
jgi:hypothetical protein